MTKKDGFFLKMGLTGLALSFDDVRLKTGFSEVIPSRVNVGSRFSRRVPLFIPIVSAPMDTVTEKKMAIAMALAGGLGIIHRNLEPQTQAVQVAQVKSFLNALITQPVCVYEDEAIEKILKGEHNFKNFPVLNREGQLVGLLTREALAVSEEGPNSLVKEVMMGVEEFLTAPVGTTLDDAYKIMQKKRKKALLLIDAQGKLSGMYVFSDLKRIKSGGQSKYNVDQDGHLRVGAAVGTGKEAIQRAKLLIDAGADVIVIDTAHGDSKPVFDTLREIRQLIGDGKTDIVVGNVSEGESAKRLADAGADGIKVGQGPGSICTTRIIAGVGCPQVTAVYNCAKALEGMDVPICADGGIKETGDIPIAIGSGASSVMMGGMLAGTDESPGKTVLLKGVRHKVYRGMGSLGAMETHVASRQRYGQPDTGKDCLVPEGVEGAVPLKGDVESELHQCVEGLKRGMGYVGAATIPELQEKADFHRMSSAGLQESHPHHVTITEEAPNYKPAEGKEGGA